MNAEHKTNFPALKNRHYYVDLGRSISFYRKRANITQKDLANRINISRPYLSRIENPNYCQSFSLEILFNISRELNVPPQYFFESFPTSKI